MKPKWVRRGIRVKGSSTLSTTYSNRDQSLRPGQEVDDSKMPRFHRLVRATKFVQSTGLNPLRWSVASQTTTLAVASFCLLVYIAMVPGESNLLVDRELEEAQRIWDDAGTPMNASTGKANPALWEPDVEPVEAAPNVPVQGDIRQSEPVSDVEAEQAFTPNMTREAVAPMVASHSHGTHRAAQAAHTPVLDPKIVYSTHANGVLELFGDPTAGFFPGPAVCRIHGACVKPNGELEIPESLRELVGRMRSCGVSQVSFREPGKTKGIVAENPGDDFFVNTMRYHMPHLASDTLSFSYALHAVAGDYGLTGDVMANTPALNPVTALQVKMKTLNANSWSRKMAQVLSRTTKLKYFDDVFPTKDTTACFRSVVLYNSQVYWQVSAGRFGSTNKILSSASQTNRSTLLQTQDTSSSPCAPRVVVLNRAPSEQRTIVNIDQILDSFHRLRQTSEFAAVAQTSLEVKYMNFSFEEQVSTMQSADIVFAAHGAALANLVFARRQTPVIEVFPFTYYANLFRLIARAMDLRHESMIAKPDSSSFLTCVHRQNDNGTHLQLLDQTWNKAVDAYTTSNDYSVLETHDSKLNPELKKVESLRMCGRTQRLEVNAERTARRLLDIAKEHCERSTEFSAPADMKSHTGSE